MELRLEKLIDSLTQIADERDISQDSPIVQRISNNAVEKVYVVVTSFMEPTNLILPLNVTWIDFNPESATYKRALRRVSKDPDPNGVFSHTWEVLNWYEDVFVDQYYDATDQALIDGSNSVSPATDTEQGVVRLSAPSPTPENPVVVGDNDPRLTDDRDPLPHSHAAVPVEQLATTGTPVTIVTSAPPQAGHVLIATSATEAEWRQLTSSDIQ